MLKKILIAVLGVIAIILIAASFQKDTYTVSRDITINASPEIIFAQINDFHNFVKWNAWANIDPAMKSEINGVGPGSTYSWNGNMDVGSGSMTIVDSTPNSVVHYSLHFVTPFEGTSTVEFPIAPEGSQTRVQWIMTGQKNFMSKIMCMFMNMDKMMGEMFEHGLKNLKQISEASAPQTAPSAPQPSGTTGSKTN